MLDVQGLRFERLFNRVTGLHVTFDDLRKLEKDVEGLEDAALKHRVLSAFGNAFDEGRILVHHGDRIIAAEEIGKESSQCTAD